ncbi:MAG: hypothetical protein RBS80_28820 [Thermoguttaceae bacterium]|jgi:hypothetical protein|nr:hypothetical protein [Thermoguttaceae bacterium]
MPTEMTGQWDDLVSRPELRGCRVKVTVIDQPSDKPRTDDWLLSLRQMAANGVRVGHPADDSRESIYEGNEL